MKGYITSKIDRNDKRKVIFQLTAKGKKFTSSARSVVSDLTNDYRKVIGERTFDDMLTNMVKLAEYQQKRNKTRKIKDQQL